VYLKTTPDLKRRINCSCNLGIGKGKPINYFIPVEQDLTGRSEGALFSAAGRSPDAAIRFPACGGPGERRPHRIDPAVPE
jgi:hypothetical protein